MTDIDFNLGEFSPNIHKFDDDAVRRMLKLLDDSDEHNDYKRKALDSEWIDIEDKNIINEFKNVINNIDDDLTPLQKLRLVYISLGYLFSYDYRVIDDMRYATDKYIDMENYIGRYQTCIQISDILYRVLNDINGIDARVIERKLPLIREEYGQNHVANEVRIENEYGDYETYLLDLTLDLYLIQAGCRTLHFGYETGNEGQYDIIPQVDNANLDQSLNINPIYTDDLIEMARKNVSVINQQNIGLDAIMEQRLINMLPLVRKFPGYYEGKQYINMLFKELIRVPYKEFNLYSKDNNITNFKTCFLFENGGFQKWLMYTNTIGLISTDENKLRSMINDGWETNSKTLRKILFK